MKATDINKINLITTAINNAVPNLDTTITEDNLDIVLTITLEKSAVIGRPRKNQLPLPNPDTDTAGGQG